MKHFEIDPALSVYTLVKNTQEQRKFIHATRMMSMISREIEDTVILDGVRARVFSSFQRMSSFLPQADRYRRLAENADSVYVFAYPDIQPPPIVNITYVPIPEDSQLAREWFIVADARDYYTALVTEELPGGPSRRFEGVWSFDEEMVDILQAALSNLVRARTLLFEQRDYGAQINLMGSTINRLAGRISGSG